ncbi:hypothetical protein [Moorena sp. SIO3I8]|uniref:hypothetical protein n=1 Tax=Moorena sp. SIO3I8 TaxID=2607833 RepID=UPI0025E3DD1E|nr:hypothetical protein [Moorena sp. SIO3I8]
MQVALKVAGYKLPRLKVASFVLNKQLSTLQPPTYPTGTPKANNLQPALRERQRRTTLQPTNLPFTESQRATTFNNV